MAVKIKLKRMGKIRAPYYRIIIADARTKRDGRAIEEIGKYHPKAEPSFIEVDSDRAQHWLSVGAQPTDPVRKILEITGDWQKFKGLPGTEGTLRTAEPKADKKVAFAAAAAESLAESGTKSKPRTRSAEGKAADAKAGDVKAGDKADAKAAEKADAKAGAKSGGKAAGAKPEAKAGGGGRKAADKRAGESAAAQPDAAAEDAKQTKEAAQAARAEAAADETADETAAAADAAAADAAAAESDGSGA